MIRERLQETWYGGRPPGFVLGVLERVYRQRLEARRKAGLARRATDLESLPIIVVGNLTAGGTGKTPLVIRLCELLCQAGLRPGVVSRGYGRRGQGRQVVAVDHDAQAVGDEPLMIARRLAVPVVVDSDREAAARTARTMGIDVLVSDDGLQRWRLPRDIEVCVMDAERGFGNGRLLPAGPLREPPERIHAVDYLVSNGGAPRRDPGRACIEMHLEAEAFVRLDGEQELDVPGFLAHVGARPLNAVAGIGHPQRFFKALAALGLQAARVHEFADHHAYNADDFKLMQGLILMTEKDAVKCAHLGLEDAWYLRVASRLPRGFEREFVARVQALVKERAA